MSETPAVEDAWFEWKRACTIERCGPESRAILAAYARSRFRSKAIEICGSLAQMPSGVRTYCDEEAELRGLAWFELEGRLWRTRRAPREGDSVADGEKPEGKLYKQWLFERAATEDEPVEFLQRYCTDILKTSAREICAIEGCDLRHLKKGREFVPLQQTIEGDDEFDLVDFLLAKADQTAATAKCAQFAAIVTEEVGRFFEGTTRRERIALAAQYAELPIYSPTVLLFAGCGKSVLSEQARNLEKCLAEHLKDLVEGVPGERAAEFVRQFHRRLLALAYEWIYSENEGEAPF